VVAPVAACSHLNPLLRVIWDLRNRSVSTNLLPRANSLPSRLHPHKIIGCVTGSSPVQLILVPLLHSVRCLRRYAGVSIGHPYRLRSSDLVEAFPGALIAKAPRRGSADTNGLTSGCPMFVPAPRSAAPGAGVAQISPGRLRGGLAGSSSAPFASLCQTPQTSPTVAN